MNELRLQPYTPESLEKSVRRDISQTFSHAFDVTQPKVKSLVDAYLSDFQSTHARIAQNLNDKIGFLEYETELNARELYELKEMTVQKANRQLENETDRLKFELQSKIVVAMDTTGLLYIPKHLNPEVMTFENIILGLHKGPFSLEQRAQLYVLYELYGEQANIINTEKSKAMQALNAQYLFQNKEFLMREIDINNYFAQQFLDLQNIWFREARKIADGIYVK